MPLAAQNQALAFARVALAHREARLAHPASIAV